jgi:hypothetical protein
MAYSNIDSLQLGNLLQIVFSNGVRNQISQDFRDFEMVKRQKAGSSVARELRFMLQKSFGTSAIQYRDPGTSGRSFPTAQQATVSEFTAKFKEINATIELEYNLWDRARKSPEKYAEPLALEIDSKSSAAKRRIAADLYGDGTGVIGTVASNTGATVTLSTSNTARGHVGFFEYGDHLKHYAANGGAGSAVTVASGTFDYWRVASKDRSGQTVGLVPVNTAGAETTVSAWTASAGEVFYRTGQPTIPNLSSIADYGTASEVIAGLESLAAGDGRLIHGITMSGALSGSRLDAGGNPIDVKYVQKAMSQVKVNVGQDRYSWKMMCMAPETLDSLIESRETDRRFMAAEDGKRGTKKFMYLHQNDELECYTSEYVPPKRIYILPETKAGEKVIEFHGSDFETVKAQGMGDFHLKPASAGGYVNTVVSYLQAIGVLVCKHPASIAVIHNFTNS